MTHPPHQTIAAEVTTITKGLPLYVSAMHVCAETVAAQTVIDGIGILARRTHGRTLLYPCNNETDPAADIEPALLPHPDRWGFIRPYDTREVASAIRSTVLALTRAYHDDRAHFDLLAAWLAPPTSAFDPQVLDSPNTSTPGGE